MFGSYREIRRTYGPCWIASSRVAEPRGGHPGSPAGHPLDLVRVGTDRLLAMSEFSPGLTLHDRFTLRERIGVGGMSEVWRADDRVLGRAVAVKALSAPLMSDPLLNAATWREARAAARLSHPHVTQVYDYGEAALPGGRVPYLVMEFVDGESLADRLRSGPLPWPDAVRIGAEVAAALAAAHRLGIVHRDVKPGNVMLTRAGAKVLDFGITALAGGRPDTDDGRLVGTPGYAAPERLGVGPVEPASDVYGLGVLLYEALTCHQPFAATTWRDAAAAHRAGVTVSPPDVAGLPDAVARLCMACLAPVPADRPTADELANGLAGELAKVPGPPSSSTAQQLAATAGHSSTAVLPAATNPARTGYSIGSARLPHPATMIEPASVLIGPPEPPPSRRSTRPLVYGLVAAVVVLALALAGVTGALLSGGRPTASPTPTSGPIASPPASSPSPSAAPSATSATAIVDQLEQTITDALAAGSIDGDAAQQLRDKLNNLSDHLGEGRAQRQIQDLTTTIGHLLDDGNIDQTTANELTTLLGMLDESGGGGNRGNGGGNGGGNDG